MQAPAKFEYSSLIGQGSNHRSLMLVTSHVRSARCTLFKFVKLLKAKSMLNPFHNFLSCKDKKKKRFGFFIHLASSF